MANHMLTTTDNPYNPHTQWDEWLAFDMAHGYNTIGLLGRIVKTSSDLSDGDDSLAIEEAIDEIVRINVLGIHKKIEAPSENRPNFTTLPG